MKISNLQPCFIIVLLIAICAIMFALIVLNKLNLIRRKLKNISDALDDIAKGNTNRKILVNQNDMTSIISYKINDIVYQYEKKLIEFKKAEETNKQLMTSLSHDVRTPLTTLIGYLDAAQKGIVVGEEHDQYIETARLKSHDMKDYVDTLFEWFKLNSDEENFIIQPVEICEMTRNILKDWIPIFENKSLNFDIDIPEKYLGVNLDISAYTRIINNLIQNIIIHSKASYISVQILHIDNFVKISITDNGKGISKENLPFIFERLYKCNKGRSEKGNGLGLSIVKQLVYKMNGTVSVKSEVDKGTEFIIKFKIYEQKIPH